MTRRRPKPLSRLARRSKEPDVRALWASTDAPAYPVREVREFQAWKQAKQAGVLPMYRRVGAPSPLAQGTASRSEGSR